MKLMIEDIEKNEFFHFEDLKNSDALYEEFVEMLKQFDKDKNSYQTDVYLYVDDNMNGTLDTFVNVGGNSWLNDDHYVLYRDKEHYNDWSDFFQTEGDIAEALGLTEKGLILRTLSYMKKEYGDNDLDIDDVTYEEIRRYITDTGLDDKLIEAENEYIDDNTSDYYDKANEVIRYFNEMQNENKSYKEYEAEW